MKSRARWPGRAPIVPAPRRSIRRASILVGVMLLATGCASRADSFGGAVAGGAEGAIRVRIDSANWSDLSVFVESRSGVRHRLGTVTTNQWGEFAVELGDVGGERPLRFVAEVIGSSDTFTTDAYLLRAGEVVVWRIGNFRSDSTVRVIR